MYKIFGIMDTFLKLLPLQLMINEIAKKKNNHKFTFLEIIKPHNLGIVNTIILEK